MAKEEKPLVQVPEQARRQLARIELDTYIGMAFSNLVAFFIILTTAATLHAQGKTDIQSAAQAAEALRPVAGDFAFLLFSLGIIGTGMLGQKPTKPQMIRERRYKRVKASQYSTTKIP